MALPAGTRLGPYEIQSALGAGGMGEVYRATDTNLGRHVAVKVLPDAFAADPERLARFEREAKTLAALNHPNIAQIYGLERSGGIRALVMELVEGPTLAERIRASAKYEVQSAKSEHGTGLPLDEALSIAKQIAEALEAAHEQGIIHRDLKPANIKLRPDGVVKVLDFGLAKLVESGSGIGDRGSGEATASPTITSPALMTGAGMLLGTAAYMSPEQARGKPVDRRADVWAFGCVLYETLSGTRAFGGNEVGDTLAFVLTKEPDWALLPAGTPAPIRRLLRRCLEKDRKRRLAAVVLAAALIVVAVPAIRHVREAPAAGAPEVRTEIVTPATTDPYSFALSPDGRQFVFVASGDGVPRLWLRSLGSAAAQPLAGTEGAATPFWSPDSGSVGFFAQGALKRIDLAGGTPQTLVTAAIPRGGTWNANGVIVFAQSSSSPLFRVAASGGDAAPVTTLDRQSSHRWPQFLPDGRHFVYFAIGVPETSGIYLGSLDGDEPARLTASDTGGAYVVSESLVWVRGGVLVAQPLDLQRRALDGAPTTVADAVAVDSTTYASAFSVSPAGLVAYRSGQAGRRHLRWVDRAGKELGTLGTPDEAALAFPRLSPDGRRALVARVVQGNSDVWLLDGTRTARLTFDSAIERLPLWSPDGTRIVFDSTRRGPRNLYLSSPTSAGAETLLLESPQDKAAVDWSRDGRFLLYSSRDPQTDWDLWVLPMEGMPKPCVFQRTMFYERAAQFSPDGRWVAYASSQSGSSEIFVRPFTEPVASTTEACAPAVSPVQWQVSTAGGIYPRWGADGKELFYIGPIGQMMAVPVAATASAFEAGTPTALFDARILGGGTDNQQGWQYDVAPDGRFLINTVLGDATAAITLLQNWRPPGTN